MGAFTINIIHMKALTNIVPPAAVGTITYLGAWFMENGATLLAPAVGAVVTIVAQQCLKWYRTQPEKPQFIKDPITGLKYKVFKEDIQKGLHQWEANEKRKKDPQDPITLNTALELQSSIQGYCEYLLNAIDGADRVVIHKFHNGGKYHTGVSTQKMKLVYEAARNKGFRIDNEISGTDFNLEKMGGILKKVVDNRYLHLTIREDKELYGFTPYFQLLQEDGVEANHLAILRSGQEKYRNIGLLSVHFIKRKKKSLNDKERMLLAKARRDIQMLLVGDVKGYPKNHI